jgi:gluconolactonase
MSVAIDPRRSALVILDLQNDVIAEGGKFADSGAPAHARSQNVVENVKSLAAAARAAGMPVVHVHHFKGAGKVNCGLFRGVEEADACVKGTWGGAPVDGLEPQEGDHVVEKIRMCGFIDTPLDSILKGVGADKIVLTGAWTNFSVEVTARVGADLGYEVVVITDGTSTVSDEWQKAALDYALTNIAERVSTAEAIEAIGSTVAA